MIRDRFRYLWRRRRHRDAAILAAVGEVAGPAARADQVLRQLVGIADRCLDTGDQPTAERAVLLAEWLREVLPDVLASAGLTAFDAVGVPLDLTRHDVVGTHPTDDPILVDTVAASVR